jgi:drug/metabolite transporter (DMT)-like permease
MNATASPSPTRQPLDLRAAVLVLGLCVIWGLQPVVIKAIAADISSAMQLAIRFSGATVFFGVWLLVREGPRTFRDGSLPSGLLLGLMFTLEFLLLAEGLNHTTASHAIVFLYSAPIFTALGLQFLPEERLRRVQWAGIAVAFLGIVIAFLGRSGRSVAELLRGDLFALLAGMGWGLSNVVLRRGRVGNSSTAKTVFYQVSVAATLMLSFCALTGQMHVDWSARVAVALVYHTAGIAISSYLVWFWLLRHYLTSRLMLLSLLTPLFGVVFGALLLGDPINLRFGLGSILVLTGILAVNARQLLQRGG